MATDPFTALANPTRRRILNELREQPRPAGELAALFELSRPSVSEHLAVLRDAALVGEQRSGRQRIYRLTAQPLAQVDAWLHPFERYWRDRLTDLAIFLDDQQKGTRP
ncbi:MAG: metalloregulator ArsR/SmtB family transcription factor [Microbacteriaceae bacterium]|nr:metalloregulator ArsR/SmtB family transcription factor [Microbacteriaceae bacterium]MCL2795459.1 metalloregulator ArsR/SmtB family transcription factor [Microbacteriaceae bacterium]